MTIFATILGTVLIVAALRDIFHELFHPSGTGGMSGMLMKAIWRLFRGLARRYPSVLTLAGPSILLTIIGSWVLILTVGWALVYWPRLPEEFLLAPGLDPSDEGSFVDAFYLSLLTLTTLGYGNIAPVTDWLRVITPLETLIGFGLLTVGVTWVLSIYPALTRRRSLAQQIASIQDAESETGISVMRADATAAERTLDALTSQLVTVRGDLTQFPITYYFHSLDERSSLPANIETLLRLAREGGGEGNPPAVRLRAGALSSALDDFSALIGSSFLGLPSASTEKVLAAYARDHLGAPSGGGER